MLILHYRDRLPRKIRKDDVICFSRTSEGVYILTKSGYGYFVDEKLKNVLDMFYAHGKFDIKGKFKEKRNG